MRKKNKEKKRKESKEHHGQLQRVLIVDASSVRPFSWSGLFGVVQSELGAGELLRFRSPFSRHWIWTTLFNGFLMSFYRSHSFLMHFVCVLCDFLVFACCILSLYLCTTRYASPGSHLMMFRSQINHVSRFSKTLKPTRNLKRIRTGE